MNLSIEGLEDWYRFFLVRIFLSCTFPKPRHPIQIPAVGCFWSIFGGVQLLNFQQVFACLFERLERALPGDESFGHPNSMGVAAPQLTEFQQAIRGLNASGEVAWCGSHNGSNFNIHLAPAMQVSLARGNGRRVPQDFLNVLEVKCQAFLHQMIDFGDGKQVKVAQGEVSGIRATDLFNSLANKTFMRMALKSLAQPGFDLQYPEHTGTIRKSTHIGDDFIHLCGCPILPPFLTYAL